MISALIFIVPLGVYSDKICFVYGSVSVSLENLKKRCRRWQNIICACRIALVRALKVAFANLLWNHAFGFVVVVDAFHLT